jgi:hypothetical protein
MGRGKLYPDANFHAGFGGNYLLFFIGCFKNELGESVTFPIAHRGFVLSELSQSWGSRLQGTAPSICSASISDGRVFFAPNFE